MRLFGTRNACVKEINDALSIFSTKQHILLADLNKRLADAKFVVPDLDIPSSGLPLLNGGLLESYILHLYGCLLLEPYTQNAIELLRAFNMT